MKHALAFLPWVSLKDKVEIGPLRLLPYFKGKLPGDLPGVTQAQIDAVLHAYAERPKHRVRAATIVELDNWQSGSEPAEPVVRRLFGTIEAFAFCALANRRLFGHAGYCCSHTFGLVVQRFSSMNLGSFAYSTRRRDGGTTNVWSSNEFAFQRPLHLHQPIGLGWDAKLLAMLLTTKQEHWLDAIVEFTGPTPIRPTCRSTSRWLW